MNVTWVCLSRNLVNEIKFTTFSSFFPFTLLLPQEYNAKNDHSLI